MNFFGVVGDVFWILALAAIAQAAWRAHQDLPADARLPMAWTLSGQPSWRLPRDTALRIMVGLPLAISLVLLWISRAPGAEPLALLIMLARLATSGGFAVLFFMWLGAARRDL